MRNLTKLTEEEIEFIIKCIQTFDILKNDNGEYSDIIEKVMDKVNVIDMKDKKGTKEYEQYFMKYRPVDKNEKKVVVSRKSKSSLSKSRSSLLKTRSSSRTTSSHSSRSKTIKNK